MTYTGGTKKLNENLVIITGSRQPRPQSLRARVNKEIDSLKKEIDSPKKKPKEISVPDLAYKFNSIRAQIGQLLGERTDIKRKVGVRALWGFVDEEIEDRCSIDIE